MVPDGTDAVILELGAIDMLWGTEPNVTRTSLASLAAILQNPNEYDVVFYPAFDDAYVVGDFKPNSAVTETAATRIVPKKVEAPIDQARHRDH